MGWLNNYLFGGSKPRILALEVMPQIIRVRPLGHKVGHPRMDLHRHLVGVNFVVRCQGFKGMKKNIQAYLGMIINQQATMKMIISHFLGLAFLVGKFRGQAQGMACGVLGFRCWKNFGQMSRFHFLPFDGGRFFGTTAFECQP